MVNRRTTARQRVEAAQNNLQGLQQFQLSDFLFGPSAAEQTERSLAYDETLNEQRFAQQQEQQAILDQQRVAQQLPGVGAAARQSGVFAPDAHSNIGMGRDAERMLQAGIDPTTAAAVIAGNAQNNPLLQAQLEQQQLQAQQDEQQRLQVLQDDRINRLRPVRSTANAVANVVDMKELLANEGKIVAPGAAKGAYNSLRGFMLNDLRVMFEAGALQQAELEFFSSMLPDASAWMDMSQDQRMAALNELEYQMTVRMDDAIAFSNTGVSRNEVMRPGRKWQDIVGKPVPGQFEEIDPSAIESLLPGGGTMPQSPRGAAPFGMFLKQFGL